MIPIQLIGAAVIAAASFATAWGVQGARYDRQLSDLRADQATALAQANADALAETLKLQKAKDEAERKAQIRIAAVKRDAAAATDALVRLHQAADTTLRHASDSHSACLATATTQRDVLNQCGTRLVEVAGHADLHASDIQTLISSWPTTSKD